MPYNNKMNNKNQKRAEKFKENNKIKAVKDNHQKHNFNSKRLFHLIMM